MRTAFLIGAGGFVGSNVAASLLEAGWQVHAFGPATPLVHSVKLSERIMRTEGSVEDRAGMEAAMTASGAEIVISFAAYSAGSTGLARAGEEDPDRAMAVNVDGFRKTLEAALATGIRRVVWSSSTTVYGPADLYPRQPVDEDAMLRPRLTYGLTKAMAEQIAVFFRDRHGLEVCSVRLPLVFGPGLWYDGAAASLMATLRSARPGARHVLEGHGASFDLMYVPDAAAAFVALAEADGPLADRYNVNGFTTRFADIVATIGRAVPGYDVEFREVAPALIFPLISSERIVRDIGFRPKFDLELAVQHHVKELNSLETR